MLAAAGLQGDGKLHPGSSLALELIAKSKDKEGWELSAVNGLQGGQVLVIVALLCVHVMQRR